MLITARTILRQSCLAILLVAFALPVTAQNNGAWEKIYTALNAKDLANARGYANVGFCPAIMSIPGKPFTAKRTFTDQRRVNGVDVDEPVSAEFTIARDEKGRVHYEMAFESVNDGKLEIGGFDIQIYDPVAHRLTRYFANSDHSLPAEPAAEVRKLQLMSELEKPLPQPNPQQKPADTSSGSHPTEESPLPGEAQPSPPPVIFVPTKDDLPIQLIDGIKVVIHRTILKYGPKQQSFEIGENWFSPEYAIDMQQLVLRETFGEETVRTSDIVDGPPDPSLFEIPPGYLVHYAQ
jgi:hypothetical protein